MLISAALKDAAIGRRQQVTDGEVTAYEPDNHNSCRYRFDFEGRQFVGVSGCPGLTGIVGEQVQIYFDPGDSTESSLEDFSQTSQRNWGVILFMAFGVCIVIGIVGISKVLKSKQSKE